MLLCWCLTSEGKFCIKFWSQSCMASAPFDQCWAQIKFEPDWVWKLPSKTWAATGLSCESFDDFILLNMVLYTWRFQYECFKVSVDNVRWLRIRWMGFHLQCAIHATESILCHCIQMYQCNKRSSGIDFAWSVVYGLHARCPGSVWLMQIKVSNVKCMYAFIMHLGFTVGWSSS